MANDESISAAELHARQGFGEAQRKVVRDFLQIVLWPIQLIADKPGHRRASADASFERLGGGSWALVDDEFGIKGDAFQERHYREFVSFLPHVQRFPYGDAPGPVRERAKGDAPLRVDRRTDIAAVRMLPAEGARRLGAVQSQ